MVSTYHLFSSLSFRSAYSLDKHSFIAHYSLSEVLFVTSFSETMGNKGVTQKNMAAWLEGVNNITIKPYDLTPLGLTDARVRMKAVGICGSDVHYYRHLKVGDYVADKPMVMGHECAGIVEEVGKDVKHLKAGDRVALEPGVACWQCEYCKKGKYNLCPDMKFFATPPVHGSLANQIIHPASLCFKLPENMSLEEGALCEPLSCGVEACNRTHVGPQTNVLVLGGGPIGLVSLLAAKAFGSPRILITHTNQPRLDLAKELGADKTVITSKDEKDLEDDVKKIKEEMGGNIHVTIDCVGSNKTMKIALKCTAPGGKVCMVGMLDADMQLPISIVSAREVDIMGIFRYKNTWPICIDMISKGKVNVKPLVTHRFGFSEKDIKAAFETSAFDRSSIKVMFNL